MEWEKVNKIELENTTHGEAQIKIYINDILIKNLKVKSYKAYEVFSKIDKEWTRAKMKYHQ